MGYARSTLNILCTTKEHLLRTNLRPKSNSNVWVQCMPNSMGFVSLNLSLICKVNKDIYDKHTVNHFPFLSLFIRKSNLTFK